MERTTPSVVVLFRFSHPEECWNVLLCVHISLPPSELWRKQRRPRSCRPWLQSLGCTGAPGVTGPLLEGIQLPKCRCSPVFNNNHLKSLQLACSYKEMERAKMWRGKEEGLQYEIQWTFWMSAPLSHGTFKKAFVLSNYESLKIEKTHCVFLIRVIRTIFELIPSLTWATTEVACTVPHFTSPPTTSFSALCIIPAKPRKSVLTTAGAGHTQVISWREVEQQLTPFLSGTFCFYWI